MLIGVVILADGATELTSGVVSQDDTALLTTAVAKVTVRPEAGQKIPHAEKYMGSIRPVKFTNIRSRGNHCHGTVLLADSKISTSVQVKAGSA